MYADEIILGLAALTTSAFAAVVGLGGGMLLLTVVPFFLPVAAIIPVHGSSQLASNLSRALFSLPSIAWSQLPAFALGSLIGIIAAWGLLHNLDLSWLPLFIGVYILCHLWWPAFKTRLAKFENIAVVGAVQTGLGPLVGATGPLTTTLLMSALKEREAIVSTNALFMSFSHAAKLILFGVLGFEYAQYWPSIFSMLLGAVAGSYLGTHLRQTINGERYLHALKYLLSVLALKLVASVLFF